MGYNRHHAIVVTSWKDECIQKARTAAVAAFDGTSVAITAITPAVVNGYSSFLIAPDGSKEGWDESDRCDHARDTYVTWLRGAAGYSIWLSWVEVNFGGDDSSWVGLRNDHGRLWTEVESGVVASSQEEK